MHKVLIPAALAATLFFSGCDGIGRTPEERINGAHPLAESIAKTQDALMKYLGEGHADERQALEVEFDSRLKIRALTCGKGNEPGLFDSDEEIRSTIANPQCFADYDAGMTDWLNHRRIAQLLSAPPLRPIPEDVPRFITAAGNIGIAWFAADAGVVLLSSARDLEILDLNTNKAIFAETGDPAGSWQSSARLSPNGRLFLTGKAGALSVRDTETGEILAEYADLQGFYWLDGQTALAVMREGSREPLLIDFANGVRVPVRGVIDGLVGVVPAPTAGEFVFCTRRSLVRIALDRTEGGVSARLLDEEPLGEMQIWADNTGGLSADRKSYVNGAGKVSIVALDRLAVRTVALESLRVISVSPTPDADRILVTGILMDAHGGNSKKFVISLRDLTIAPLEGDTAQLRYIFIPSINRLGTISQSRIEVLDVLPLGAFRSFEDFTAELRSEAQIRQLEAFQQGSGNAAGIPAGLPGPDWAKDARIEAVGVYESTDGSHGPGKPRRAGPVMVRVRRSGKPVVLVLTSYEPVQWHVSTDPGARVAAILTGGYYQSEVRGQTARQIDIGRVYAYEQGSGEYGRLEVEVARRTGKRIDQFQGRYSGNQFTVGGN